MRICEHCGGAMRAAKNRHARFCTPRCRLAAHRASKRVFPASMTDRVSWVRASGKRPVTTSGSPASSTNPDTWSSFAAVLRSSAGDGFGVMLGGGLGCYDLDHCIVDGELEPDARVFVESIPEPLVFVERSMSGTGLHVSVEADEGPGMKRGGVERYTRERFIRVTGDRIDL